MLLGLSWLLLMMIAVGCGDEGTRMCNSQDDCSENQICQAGRCVDLCRTHEDCPDNWVCDDGFCVIPSRCGSQDDCEYDEACVGGRCIPQISECVTSADCPPGHNCDRGACVPRDDPDAGPDGIECFTPDECPDEYSCIDNVCVPWNPDPAPDMGDDIDDTGGDSVLDSDPQPDGSPDLAPDSDELDECAGRENGRLGDPCTAGSDCCNGLCLGNPDTGQGICTEPCTTYDDCNPEDLTVTFFCYDLGDDVRFCAPSDFGTSCNSPDVCLGGVCLHGYGTSGCSWFCEYTAECPPQTACGLVSFWDEESEVIVNINTCAPVGTACTVHSTTGFNDCLSGLCITEDDSYSGFCSTFCNTYDPQPCPTGYRCEIIESDSPPVCIP